MTQQRQNPFRDDIGRRTLDRRKFLRHAGALSVGFPARSGAQSEVARVAARDLAPPDAPARPKITAHPGGPEIDLYAWLENPDDPEVIAYLEAENAYTEAVLAPTRVLQTALYQEMTQRFNRCDVSVPTPWRGYLYYQRTEAGKDFPILCRCRGDACVARGAPEQILLDLNAIAADYLHVSVWRPSPDNRFLAFNLDETGAELYTLYIMDMTSARIVEELPPSREAEWAQDSRTLYYCRQDESRRSYQLNRHTIGNDPATDTVLYQEDDENFWLRISTAKDRTFLFLESFTVDTNEVSILPADQPETGLTVVSPRRRGVQTVFEHHGDDFLILTDDGAPNFTVMAAPAGDPARANWRVIVPHRTQKLLASFEVFADHLVLYGREDGFPRVWIHDFVRGTSTPVHFEEAVYTVGRPDGTTGGENWEFNTATVRLHYSSPITPDSIYEVDMTTGKRTLLKQSEVIGGHDPSRYTTKRLFATAPDGVQVPISLAYLREPPAGLPAGPRPLRLDAYGGYGISLDPSFSLYRLTLIDRGVSFAIAHIRGGSELGRRWWDEGRLRHKRTSFSDFIACAEHLIAQGYTAPDRLAIHGASIGGLVMGVVANERPDLFRAVVAEVPAVDVIGFLLRSAIGPANQDELGDPHDPAVYDDLRAYSPYQNLAAQAYPAIFVTAALNDNRTPYWVPAKWVARLRDVKTDDNPLLLHTGLSSGHLSVTAFSGLSRELALWYAFVLDALGLTAIQPNVATAAAPKAEQRPLHRRKRRVTRHQGPPPSATPMPE